VRIRIWYDNEADVFVGKDYDSGVMSQGEGSLDALMATREAVQIHNFYNVKSTEAATPAGGNA
jgi:hypothetical protein